MTQATNLLSIRFDISLEREQLPAFRGALLEQIPRTFSHFHNHEQSGKTIYRYPRIQYKLRAGKPQILCLGQGIAEAEESLLQQDVWELTMRGKPLRAEIMEVCRRKYYLDSVEEADQYYRIVNWQALNQQNFETFMETERLMDQVSMLENIMINNVISFAKSVHWDVPRGIRIEFLDWLKPRSLDYKGIQMKGFNLTFRSNLLLPEWIGLGKGVSRGMGMLYHYTPRKARAHRS